MDVEPIRVSESLQMELLCDPQRERVHNLVDELSRLTQSRLGLLRNNLGARARWLGDKTSAFGEMARRKGVWPSAAYYAKRIAAMLQKHTGERTEAEETPDVAGRHRVE